MVDVTVTNTQIEDIDIPKALPEDPDPLPKRQVTPNFLANKIQNNISAWKEVVPLKVFKMLKHGIILPLFSKSGHSVESTRRPIFAYFFNRPM